MLKSAKFFLQWSSNLSVRQNFLAHDMRSNSKRQMCLWHMLDQVRLSVKKERYYGTILSTLSWLQLVYISEHSRPILLSIKIF